jgi:hypothetical protein
VLLIKAPQSLIYSQATGGVRQFGADGWIWRQNRSRTGEKIGKKKLKDSSGRNFCSFKALIFSGLIGWKSGWQGCGWRLSGLCSEKTEALL